MIYSIRRKGIKKFSCKEEAREYIKIYGGVALDSQSNWMIFKHNLPKPKRTIFNFNFR